MSIDPNCVNRCGPCFGWCNDCWTKAFFALATANTYPQLELVSPLYDSVYGTTYELSLSSRMFVDAYRRTRQRLRLLSKRGFDERLENT